MITFKYKGNGKRYEVSDRITQEKLLRALSQLFPLKGSVLGFRSEENIYYDIESFISHRARLSNTIVDIIEGNQHLEISFSSDNVSSMLPADKCNSAYIPNQNPGLVQIPDQAQIQAFDNRLVVVLVLLQDTTKQWIIDRATALANKCLSLDVMFGYQMATKPKEHLVKPPSVSVYVDKVKLCEIRITANWHNQIQKLLEQVEIHGGNDGTEAYSLVKAMEKMDEDCPSFMTVNIADRLSKELVLDNLSQMLNQHIITEHQFSKLSELTGANLVQFCRLFCQNLTETDYDTFKVEVEAHLQRYRVEENQLFEGDRPIPRQQQRKQSAASIEVLKVESFLDILEQLEIYIKEDQRSPIKRMVLEEDRQMFNYFDSYVQGKIDKVALANYLVIEAVNKREPTRPISRCLPRDKPKDAIPQFGQKAQMSGSLSPIRGLVKTHSFPDIQSYLNNNASKFSSSQLGTLIHLLQSEDHELLESKVLQDSQDQLMQIKQLADRKFNETLLGVFKQSTVDHFNRQKSKKNSPIHIIYENFRYQSNPEQLIQELRVHVPTGGALVSGKSDQMPLINLRVPANFQSGDNQPNQEDWFQFENSNKQQEETRLQKFYNTVYWESEFDQFLGNTLLPKRQKQLLTQYFRTQSPFVFMTLRQYIKSVSQNQKFDQSLVGQFVTSQRRQFKREAGPANSQLRKYHLFRSLLLQLYNSGKIKEDHRDYLMLAFIEETVPVVACFETYLVNKNQNEFVETLDIILRLHRSKTQKTELDIFVNRMVFFLNQIYEHTRILNYTIQTYSAAFRGICQKEQTVCDSQDFFQSIDILNSLGFNKRFNRQLAKMRMPLHSKMMIINLFEAGELNFMEGLIDTFEYGNSFPAYIMQYCSVHANKLGEKAAVEKALKDLAKAHSNPRLLQALKYYQKGDQSFCSIWQLYKSNNDQQDFADNVTIMLDLKQPKVPLAELAMLYESPILRRRYQQQAAELLEILKLFKQDAEAEVTVKLKEYEERETPVIVRQTLLGLGLTSEKIKILLERFGVEIIKLVVGNLGKCNREEFLFQIEPFLSSLLPAEEFPKEDN